MLVLEKQICIVTEYIEGGTLQDLIIRRKFQGKKITNQEAIIIIRHLLSAVEYLHDKGIVHRDIKLCISDVFYCVIYSLLENILIQDPNDFSTIKLIDFGFSTYLNDNLTQYCGTLKYMAPELILKNKYGLVNFHLTFIYPPTLACWPLKHRNHYVHDT